MFSPQQAFPIKEKHGLNSQLTNKFKKIKLVTSPRVSYVRRNIYDFFNKSFPRFSL